MRNTVELIQNIHSSCISKHDCDESFYFMISKYLMELKLLSSGKRMGGDGGHPTHRKKKKKKKARTTLEKVLLHRERNMPTPSVT